jgi:3-hydroxyacyl-[acyl-carrier-protein] dehydratase
MKSLSREQIEALIPHRPPFLWLDAAEVDGDSIVATKSLPPDLPLFEGHYPGQPVLPGVIQLEMCFQASAALVATFDSGGGGVPVVARTDGVKFKRMIRPGETCTIEVSIKDRLPGAYYLTGKVRVDGQLACRCDFTTAEAKPEPLSA